MSATVNPVSRLTLLDKVNVCLQDFGDHVMHLVFDIDGTINIERLNRAVRFSLIEHPIMAQKLVYRFGQPKWTAWSQKQLDQTEFCTLIQTANRQSAINDFMLRLVDFTRSPMVTIQVIEGETQTLCIKVSCVPIDGRGFLIYVERILALYELLKTQADYAPVPGTLNHRSTKALAHYFKPLDVLKLIVSGLKNQLDDSATAKNWHLPFLANTQLDKAYYCHSFQPQRLADINAFRRQHHLTFNDVLLAAYYLSLYEIIKPEFSKEFCVLNTYDLRRYEDYTAPERVANYSSFINTNVKLNNQDRLLTAAKKVKQAIDQRKAHYPGMTEGPFIWPILTFLPFRLGSYIVKQLLKHRGEQIPVFTNVGIIDTNRMRINEHPIRQVHAFAPLEFPPKLTVTLATAGNVITLSVGYSRNHFPEDMIHALFHRMEQIIANACATRQRVAA